MPPAKAPLQVTGHSTKPRPSLAGAFLFFGKRAPRSGAFPTAVALPTRRLLQRRVRFTAPAPCTSAAPSKSRPLRWGVTLLPVRSGVSSFFSALSGSRAGDLDVLARDVVCLPTAPSPARRARSLPMGAGTPAEREPTFVVGSHIFSEVGAVFGRLQGRFQPVMGKLDVLRGVLKRF